MTSTFSNEAIYG